MIAASLLLFPLLLCVGVIIAVWKLLPYSKYCLCACVCGLRASLARAAVVFGAGDRRADTSNPLTLVLITWQQLAFHVVC